jgi:type I restriction enzyme, R subunit
MAFGALGYFSRAAVPISRSDRAIAHKSLIFSRYVGKQQEFLDFVLEQYIKVGVGELDRAKLPQLLELKYHNVRDAVAELGSVGSISEIFIDFQEYLYTRDKTA